MVFRVYVEKSSGFDVQARHLAHELTSIVGISGLRSLRVINRYDVEGISKELFDACIPTVFSEPQSDTVTYELPVLPISTTFAVEYLPGQFDQREESASECIQLISQGERPTVRSATIYALDGDLTASDMEAVKSYVINPVEAREASLAQRDSLDLHLAQPSQVEILDGFRELDEAGLLDMIAKRDLAMDVDDLAFCQDYFRSEQRDPSITEIKVIDTYWSDHCRHTTFGTELKSITIDDATVQAAFKRYLSIRHELGRDEKPRCLMDMATIGAKYLKSKGILKNLDESEEINACTVKTKVDVDGEQQDWLFLFKNETHNHPTEIEPFGGAATCIGGAIRDPLSGRSYVYQAMRVTGAADPRTPVSETLQGKLPQRKIVTTAADGYSSYGNQIGLATGQVHEIYHPGYVAKRMEVGAVVGATPANHVRRETPAPGDSIILLGGRTGRDGIGGATGASKSQNAESLEDCGAEVQKGNPIVERKLQRLFRRGDAAKLIKRCNDFGAGGVSVATGELADGLLINLDAVKKKYAGLNGTELAISESQERMAVALDSDDVDEFMRYAKEENLEATVVGKVSEEKRLRMEWRGDTIVDISREFLASNGAPKRADVHVEHPLDYQTAWHGRNLEERLHALVTDLNVCSNKGLSERFDSTIGASTVLMPFGGRRQLTTSMAMVAKFPVPGETTTVSGMAWGFNPYITEKNQYTGAYLAVIESVAKLVAAGFHKRDMYLSLQEYFEKLGSSPERWGKPFASVLGALSAQLDLGVGAIGGKDSMSGSFEKLDVPPTLISFAVAVGTLSHVISPELKKAGSRLIRVTPRYLPDNMTPEVKGLTDSIAIVEKLIDEGNTLAVSTPGYGCTAAALFDMTLGNHIGLRLNDGIQSDSLFLPAYGSFIVEFPDDADIPESTGMAVVQEIGVTTEEYQFATSDERVDLSKLQEDWEHQLEDVFPYRSSESAEELKVKTISFTKPEARHDAHAETSSSTVQHTAHPRVIIPVFPGTNCEFDTIRAFERAGAETSTLVIRNLTPSDVTQSAQALEEAIRNSQIVMLPGGFSGGDEPDGSAKFIADFFRSPAITEAVRDLLNNRDGLMLGICNGFQALVKLGLVPYGDIVPMTKASPTLTYNTIGRHQSKLVRTRIGSTMSPWLSRSEVGDTHTIAISHGDGRFVAGTDMLNLLAGNGQIATQYVDANGVPSMDLDVNPNGSVMAIEGITSPDGRILGKMAHTERSGNGLYQNVPDASVREPLIESGVDYFRA
ncbi:phosphoribosylformylglycinamidine synthase [Bifidobacterium aquikefiricola]|uniref:Phosphoribosylformylglycinamidine synthase n=1 Tax=Bifidobacterium aquikefiricola TaxID=3059038 RepID=A0AB39U8I7_9BIFI